MPLPREYTPETLLPSSSLFFFALLLSFFLSLVRAVSASLLHALAVLPSGCRSDTLDVTAGLFVAVIPKFLFLFFISTAKWPRVCFTIIPTCHITCIRKLN